MSVSSEEGSSSKKSASTATPWLPGDSLRKVSDLAMEFSKGFLRCRPERWFPGFGTQWIPLSHSLGVEAICNSVKPMLALPGSECLCYEASIAGEKLGVVFDVETSKKILEILTPGAVASARKIVLDYVARRFLGSCVLAWSGPELGNFQYVGSTAVDEINAVACVQLSFTVTGEPLTFWVLLGKNITTRFDGLWRRQVKSTASQSQQDEMELTYELAQIPLPADSFEHMLKPGTNLDLQVPVRDQVSMKVGMQDWLPGQLRKYHGNFAIEIMSGPLQTPEIPEGHKSLGVVVGTQRFSSEELRELAQVGALIDTKIPIGDMVKLYLDGQFVRSGVVKCYDGRFIVTVS